ncbi:MAG: Rap1a/Tai family immunity protein [Rhizomicrobium sp.]
MKPTVFALAGVIAAAVTCTALPQDAFALTESGMQFYNQCGTGFGAGFANRAFCHNYILGFADGLGSVGRICPGPGTTDTQIVIVVQNWLRSHARNLNAPASLMVRNALLNAWPCGPG